MIMLSNLDFLLKSNAVLFKVCPITVTLKCQFLKIFLDFIFGFILLDSQNYRGRGRERGRILESAGSLHNGRCLQTLASLKLRAKSFLRASHVDAGA